LAVAVLAAAVSGEVSVEGFLALLAGAAEDAGAERGAARPRRAAHQPALPRDFRVQVSNANVVFDVLPAVLGVDAAVFKVAAVSGVRFVFWGHAARVRPVPRHPHDRFFHACFVAVARARNLVAAAFPFTGHRHLAFAAEACARLEARVARAQPARVRLDRVGAFVHALFPVANARRIEEEGDVPDLVAPCTKLHRARRLVPRLHRRPLGRIGCREHGARLLLLVAVSLLLRGAAGEPGIAGRAHVGGILRLLVNWRHREKCWLFSASVRGWAD